MAPPSFFEEAGALWKILPWR